MSERWHVCLAGGQKIAWALDEDLHWVRRSLGERCKWTSLPPARIVHAAWPAAVNAISEGALRGKTVVCQADNPPSFYLGTEDFAEAAARVDLWLARTSEAAAQFEGLGLRAARVPYCVNPEIFRRLPGRDVIRRSLGIAAGDFVIGNFHRDSEGNDLRQPKKQKGPDVFFEIAKQLNGRIPHLVALLAGPRRHWLLSALRAEGIRVAFAGNEPGADDDYARNILARERLNELYQALDVCVVSSRWEGGPYSVLEALAAGTAVISSPVGTSRDVLPAECVFRSVAEAADLLERHAGGRSLDALCGCAAEKAARTHGPEALKKSLLAVYEGLPAGGVSMGALFSSAWAMLRRGRRRKASASIEQVMKKVRQRAAGITESPGLIHFQDGGDREDLIGCAAQIVAARTFS